MKKAKAKISAVQFKKLLKLPFHIELVSASYEKGSDHLDIVLQGDSLPVKAVVGKGRIPEINYDPRPTWTVAGMSPLKGK